MTTLKEIISEETDIQTSLEYLSDLCLQESGVYQEYTDRDLFNAVEIYQHVFMSKMYDAHKKKLTHPQLEKLAEEAGKSIRQTVLLFCGKDMHKVAKGL